MSSLVNLAASVFELSCVKSDRQKRQWKPNPSNCRWHRQKV